jgi:MFS family permease
MSTDWRRMTGLALRGFGFLLGAAIAAIYLILMIEFPPPNWQHMRPRSFIIGYVGLPLGLFIGPAWLLGWIAGRIDKRSPLG